MERFRSVFGAFSERFGSVFGAFSESLERFRSVFGAFLERFRSVCRIAGAFSERFRTKPAVSKCFGIKAIKAKGTFSMCFQSVDAQEFVMRLRAYHKLCAFRWAILFEYYKKV